MTLRLSLIWCSYQCTRRTQYIHTFTLPHGFVRSVTEFFFSLISSRCIFLIRKLLFNFIDPTPNGFPCKTVSSNDLGCHSTFGKLKTSISARISPDTIPARKPFCMPYSKLPATFIKSRSHG